MNPKILKAMFWGIVLLYLGVRLPLVFMHPIGIDEIRDVSFVTKAIERVESVYHGARFSDKGHLPSPIYYNILIAGYLLTDSIIGMRLIVLLINFFAFALLMYWLLYRLSKNQNTFSPNKLTNNIMVSSIISGLWIAVSPWLTKYTTFSWNPNFLPAVSALYFIGAYETITVPRSRYIFFTLLALFVGISMHVYGLPLIIGFALLLIFYQVKLNWTYITLALAIITFLLLIFVYYDFTNDWTQAKLLITDSDAKGYQIEAFKVLQYLLLVTTTEMSNFILRGWTHNLNYWFNPSLGGFFKAFFYVLILVLSIGATLIAHYEWIKTFYHQWKDKSLSVYFLSHPLYGFLWINVGTTILFSLILGKPFVDRYMLGIAYFMIMLVVIGLLNKMKEFLSSSSKKYSLIIAGVVSLFLLYNLYLTYEISVPHPLHIIFW